MLRRSVEVDFHQELLYAEFPLSETPYISAVNADDEFLTIYNPSSTEICLKDYYVADSKRLHRFIFTDDEDKIAPHGLLYLYTCPVLSMERKAEFKEPYVLWRNLDGSLRRKEVLNNDHCEMLLFAPSHKCIASCTTDRNGQHLIKRREEELHAIPSLHFSLTQRCFISVLRILALFAFTICALEHHPYRLLLYWAAFVMDLFSREASTYETSHSSLATLNRYGDDICLSVLYLSAILYCSRSPAPDMSLSLHSYTNGTLRVVLIGGALLELTALSALASSDNQPDTWMLSTHNGESPSQQVHLRSRHQPSDAIYAMLRHVHPALVTFVCLASETFLLSYVPDADWSADFLSSEFSAETIGVLVSAVAFLVRQSNNLAVITHHAVLQRRTPTHPAE